MGRSDTSTAQTTSHENTAVDADPRCTLLKQILRHDIPSISSALNIRSNRIVLGAAIDVSPIRNMLIIEAELIPWFKSYHFRSW